MLGYGPQRYNYGMYNRQMDFYRQPDAYRFEADREIRGGKQLDSIFLWQAFAY